MLAVLRVKNEPPATRCKVRWRMRRNQLTATSTLSPAIFFDQKDQCLTIFQNIKSHLKIENYEIFCCIYVILIIGAASPILNFDFFIRPQRPFFGMIYHTRRS